MSRTLYVSDLDGTLLNNNSEVSEKSSEIINRLSDEGALITVATARTPATVADLMKNTHINIPVIVMTGAATYDLGKGVYESEKFLKPWAVEGALEVFEKSGINPFVYTWRPDNVLHAYHSLKMTRTEELFYMLRRDGSLKKFHLDVLPDDEAKKHTLLLFATGNREQLLSIRAHLEEKVGYPVSYYNDIFSADNGFIEVFADGVSKAEAVKEMKSRIGADRVVVFGDNLNDIPMMKVADVAVAVENAFPEVKSIAQVIIGENTKDSVAEFIAQDFKRK